MTIKIIYTTTMPGYASLVDHKNLSAFDMVTYDVIVVVSGFEQTLKLHRIFEYVAVVKYGGLYYTFFSKVNLSTENLERLYRIDLDLDAENMLKEGVELTNVSNYQDDSKCVEYEGDDGEWRAEYLSPTSSIRIDHTKFNRIGIDGDVRVTFFHSPYAQN